MMHRSVPFVIASALLALATGCVPVPAFDHERLAHPTMTPEDVSFGLDGHVRAVSEGATGALAGAGGGCGCN